MICLEDMNNQIGFSYQIVYKPIRHLYIRVKQGKVIVTCGKHFSQQQVEAFLLERENKIIELLNKEKRVILPQYQVFDKVLEASDFFQGLTINDKNYEIMLKKYTETKIIELRDWLSIKLKLIGLNLVSTKVKKLKSKYGSCHIVKREITINSFMARLPEIYLKYVLLHEYAHLIVANHSAAFYKVLDQLMVDHKKIQRSLRKIPIEFR